MTVNIWGFGNNDKSEVLMDKDKFRKKSLAQNSPLLCQSFDFIVHPLVDFQKYED